MVQTIITLIRIIYAGILTMVRLTILLMIILRVITEIK